MPYRFAGMMDAPVMAIFSAVLISAVPLCHLIDRKPQTSRTRQLVISSPEQHKQGQVGGC